MDTEMDQSRGIVIVGGGIAGLAVALRLQEIAPDVPLTLVEREERLGGKLLTERVDGFLVEAGPESFLAAKPRGADCCRELGLGDRLQGVNPTPGASVLFRGRLHRLPEGLTGLVPTRLGPIARSELLSPAGKARLALDFVLPPRKGDGDESLASFVERRIGREIYERLVEPLLTGIYAGDGRRLSLAATFPQLREAERAHGGLIKGALAAGRRAPAAPPGNDGQAPRPSPFLTPVDGVGAIVEAIESRLRAARVRLLTGRSVRCVRREADGYSLSLDGGEALGAAAVVLATPAFVTARLVAELDPLASAYLGAIPHVSTAVVSLAYHRDEVPHPLDGSGYVVPRIARRAVTACTWTSAKWANRAPAGHALVRVFVGRDGEQTALAGSDDDLVRLARAELGEVLGIAAEPLFVRVDRWPDGMPQYTLGHLDRVRAAEERLAAFPGLSLAGASYRGVGIPDCIRSGEAAAEAAARHGRVAVRAVA
jgi:oxygen-dependent protoporphyrinogen oxidase